MAEAIFLLPKDALIRIVQTVLETKCGADTFEDASGRLYQAVRDSYINGFEAARAWQEMMVKKGGFSPRMVHLVETKRKMLWKTCKNFRFLEVMRNEGASWQEFYSDDKRLVMVYLNDERQYGPKRVLVLHRRDMYFDTFAKDSDLDKTEKAIRPLIDEALEKNKEQFFLAESAAIVDISKAVEQIKKSDASDVATDWLFSKAPWVKIQSTSCVDNCEKTIVKVQPSSWVICAVMPPVIRSLISAYRGFDSQSDPYDSVFVAMDARACASVFAAVGMTRYGDDWLDTEFGEDCIEIIEDFEELLVIFGADKTNLDPIEESIRAFGSGMTMRDVWNIHRRKRFPGIFSILDLVKDLQPGSELPESRIKYRQSVLHLSEYNQSVIVP